MTPGISAEPSPLLDAYQSIPAASEHNEAKPNLRREPNSSLRRDREIRWSHHSLGTEHVDDMRNVCKPFHLVRALGVNEGICEANDSAVYRW